MKTVGLRKFQKNNFSSLQRKRAIFVLQLNDLKNKIRHIYDLNQMLKDKEIKNFFNTQEFKKLLVDAANDDMLSYKSGNEWLQNHPTQAIIFKESADVWRKLKPTYFSTFNKLV